jgi:hypothetical protein
VLPLALVDWLFPLARWPFPVVRVGVCGLLLPRLGEVVAVPVGS